MMRIRLANLRITFSWDLVFLLSLEVWYLELSLFLFTSTARPRAPAQGSPRQFADDCPRLAHTKPACHFVPSDCARPAGRSVAVAQRCAPVRQGGPEYLP